MVMQNRQEIYVFDAIRVIHEWVAKGRPYFWAASPEWVIGTLKAHAKNTNNKMIDYHEAVKILQRAETTKMPGHANAGMEWIKTEWRKFKCQTSL
jgi:hypothetical protein